MGKVPKWATELLQEVLKDYECNKIPEISWYRSKNWFSSGYANSNKIHITAGKRNRKDQKLVLLHELAHWLLPSGTHHNSAFWDLAFELYRKYKVPMMYARNRERGYRKEAVLAYRRNRKKINE